MTVDSAHPENKNQVGEGLAPPEAMMTDRRHFRRLTASDNKNLVFPTGGHKPSPTDFFVWSVDCSSAALIQKYKRNGNKRHGI